MPLPGSRRSGLISYPEVVIGRIAVGAKGFPIVHPNPVGTGALPAAGADVGIKEPRPFRQGVLLSAAFQRYVPAETMTALFGGNEALGVLMAATVGVPLYACGGGTIPLLQQWLLDGMRPGSAAAFLLTGPSTKITNLGALKIVLGWKHFLLYLAFVMGFSLAAGLIVNAIL